MAALCLCPGRGAQREYIYLYLLMAAVEACGSRGPGWVTPLVSSSTEFLWRQSHLHFLCCLSSLFGFTVPALPVLPQSLYCWAGMLGGGSAGQACKTLGWGPKEPRRAGRGAKTENGDPPSALRRAVRRETRGWGGREGAGGAAGKNPGEGLKEERPPRGSRWVPSGQDAHGAPGPSQRNGAGGGSGGSPGRSRRRCRRGGRRCPRC